jgi:hypothetical protein
LVFYLTIATQRTFRILVIISIGVVAIFSTVMIFINAFECPKSPSFALTPGIFIYREKEKCFELHSLYYSQAAINMFTDTAILILPMPVLITLRMPKLKRLSLLAVFSVGMLVPIASGLRIWGLYLWASSGDLSRYYGGYVLFWSQIELNTAIICASAPSLQPLFRHIFGDLSRFQRTRNAYYYYGGQPTMLEIQDGQIQPVLMRDPLSSFTSPEAAYLPAKRCTTNDTETFHVRDFDEEEDIRNNVRVFAIKRDSAQSQEPKSPVKSRDRLASW